MKHKIEVIVLDPDFNLSNGELAEKAIAQAKRIVEKSDRPIMSTDKVCTKVVCSYVAAQMKILEHEVEVTYWHEGEDGK